MVVVELLRGCIGDIGAKVIVRPVTRVCSSVGYVLPAETSLGCPEPAMPYVANARDPGLAYAAEHSDGTSV